MEIDRKLKPEFKKLWLEDLRSGKHVQARGYLKRVMSDGQTVGYCCLGRACDIAPGTGHWAGVMMGDGDTHAEAFVGEDAVLQIPPCDIYEAWFEDGPPWNDDDRRLVRSVMNLLTSRNDEGHTFAQIADWIETNL